MYFLGLDFESTSKTLGTASVELNGNPTPFPWAAQIRFAPRRGFLGRTKSCHPYSSEHLGHSYKTLSGFDPKKNYWSNGTIFRIHDKLGYFLMFWQKKTEEMSAPGGVENSRPFSGDSLSTATLLLGDQPRDGLEIVMRLHWHLGPGHLTKVRKMSKGNQI